MEVDYRVCPYCGNKVDSGVYFGEFVLHEDCYLEFGEELEAALGSDDLN